MAAVPGNRAQGAVTEIPLCDDRYPALLREIHDPPEVLYVRGNPDCLCQPLMAIVGSRRGSAAALRFAQLLAGQLGAAGLNICSGLALGIDAAAHRGALDAGVNTVGTMATGIDRVYPKRHSALAGEIASQGCLVTEFPPGMPPLRENFPRRNRIISGLSVGVLVVEAAIASGSLITARTALEQGREVFAVPWSPLHTGGAGCLQLLRDGAKMVASAEDILEELGPLYALAGDGCSAQDDSTVAPQHKRLLRLIGYEIASLDTLVASSGSTSAQVMAALAQLELEGHIQRAPGGYIRT
ncbi:MAG: DNA-processing protein DprA [Gammaproteobacteria bacterium]|jgi:DNA processing protein|nr:DNA-processing protein DprA [Gammaproteobacteria bacterium]